MGMLARRLPKFRWFQSRPKTAWCCRWVLGSVAGLLIAATVLSFFTAVDVWLPRWFRVSLWWGHISYQSDPITSNGQSVWETLNFGTPGIKLLPVSMDQITSAPLGGMIRKHFTLPEVQTLVFAADGTPHLYVDLPIWLLIVPVLPLAIAAWRNRRVVKREVGTCHHCGYSRTGLAGGETAVCPECGTAPAAPIAKS